MHLLYGGVRGGFHPVSLAGIALAHRATRNLSVDPSPILCGGMWKDAVMRNPDDPPVMLAKVIDFEQARARREKASPEQEDSPDLRAAGRIRELAALKRSRERTAQKRRRLLERTARKRSAAATQRIQLRVADRLATIEAELEAEIARLRLAYAQRRRRAGGGIWMWPTVALSLLALVASMAYFAGTQRTYVTSAAVSPPRVAATHVEKRPGRARIHPPAAMKFRAQRTVPSCPGARSPSGAAQRSASGSACGGTPHGAMSPTTGFKGGIP